MPHVLVLLNAGARTLEQSKTADEPQRIEAGLRDAGVTCVVQQVDPATLTDIARQACDDGFDAVFVGGGDGTVSTVAAALVGTDTPLGVLPLGTLNHFSRDQGVPADLDDAVRALARGLVAKNVTAVHVATVNDRPFLLSLAIGFYPHVVRHRDAQRRSRGRGKWVAMFIAMARVFTRLPLTSIKLQIGTDTLRRYTPLLFICTSKTELHVFGIDDAGCLDRGNFTLFVAHRVSRLRLLGLAFRSMVKRLKPARDFEAMCLNTCTLQTRHRHIRVAIDGEVEDLPSPLKVEMKANALHVIRPVETTVTST